MVGFDKILNQEALKEMLKEVVETVLEEKGISNLKEQLDSLESLFQRRLDSLERRLDSLESSFYAVERGVIEGERKRREIRKIREVSYSSYEGFNTRQWIRGVGG